MTGLIIDFISGALLLAGSVFLVIGGVGLFSGNTGPDIGFQRQCYGTLEINVGFRR